MKCCSRLLFGIAIGGINILIYMGVSMGMIRLYRDSTNKTGGWRLLVGLLLIVCLAMATVSGLLIFGLVKRLHKFIYPWLVTSGVVFLCNVARGLYALILAFKETTALHTWLWMLLIDVLALVVQGLIIWPIFTLYQDIKNRHNRCLQL